MRPIDSKLPRLIRRSSSPHLILTVLIAFGATVLLVRVLLELTGYPRLGNGTLHIAHMLYGGICLTLACLLMLIFATPSVHRIGSVLTGIGLGLFFDEVGKFITANNDYFFRPAAPIIYLVSLIIAGLFYYLRRREDKPSDAELMVDALEDAEALLEGRQTEQQHRHIDAQIDRIANNMSDADHIKLALALREFADSEAVRPGRSRWQIMASAIEQWILRQFIVHQRPLEIVLLVILVANSLSTLVTFAVVLVTPVVDPGLASQIQDVYSRLGLRAFSPFALSIDNVDLALSFVTAILTIYGVTLLLARRQHQGLYWVQLALILELCVVNVFTFYVEQFSAALFTLADLAILLYVRTYAHQLRLATFHRQHSARSSDHGSPSITPVAGPSNPSILNQTNP